jgi:hypothetical protein
MPLLHRFVEPERMDGKFYNGTLCPTHGTVLRYRANSHCVQCAKDYAREKKRKPE